MQRSATAWSALSGNPLRLLLSSWPWRAFAYLVSAVVVGLLTLALFLVAVGVGIVTSPIVVGLVILSSVPLLGVYVGIVERRRLQLMSGSQTPPLPSPYLLPPGVNMRERLRLLRREPASWRELGYAMLLATLLWVLDAVVVTTVGSVVAGLVAAPFVASFDQVGMGPWTLDSVGEAVPFTLVGLPVVYAIAAYLVTMTAAAQAALARILLSPSEAMLEARINELRRSRLDLVDAFETERRRIERHLHDGVQQRLVALTMTLGRAELEVPPGEGLALVQQGHREAESALGDLREAVRGIHPRVLVDHGLAAAVREVADRMPVPVTVDIALPDRLPKSIEAAAYFVASEGLGNVAKHARARSCSVRGWIHDDRLVLSVGDDGVGGARTGAGTGLAGLVTRLDALGGTLTVTSPDGGPTELRMECPCQIDP